jgi:hypothetical protein
MRLKKLSGSSVSIILIITVLSVLEAAFLMNFHIKHLGRQAVATFSPIDGHAWWRAFQNRLLPAEILSLIHANNVENSYRIFILIFTFICNFLFFLLFSKYGNKKAWIMTLIFSLAFLLSQSQIWLYGWDFLNVVITILVLIGIDNDIGEWYFICVFILAIFNSESALYIPLWLFISALPYNKKKAFYSLFLLAIGAGLLYYLRLTLFNGSIINSIGLDNNHKLLGNHVYLLMNLKYPFTFPLTDTINAWHYDFIPAVVVTSYLFCLRQWKNIKYRNVLIYAGIMILACFTFGYIHETRIWLPVIPALLYLYKDILWEETVTNTTPAI